MAKLVDALPGLNHRVRRKYRKVFEKLSDEFFLRTPAQEEYNVANVIIEGPEQRWLFIGDHPHPPELSEIKSFLSLNETLLSHGSTKINYLAVCTGGESLFSDVTYSDYNVIIVDKQAFWDRGPDFINDYLHQVSDQTHIWLKKHLITESTINPSCTTRRHSVTRDTTARLDNFFLDYDQELATKLDLWGEADSNALEESFSVRLINGVAGCGKTLILINRALLYCKKYPEKQVLLLIHNKPVTADIEFKIERYLGGTPDNLRVSTFHKYARSQQAKRTPWLKVLFSNKDKKPFLNDIFKQLSSANSGLNLSAEQIFSEIDYINEFLITDLEHYLSFDRQGRGFPLSKAQREQVWALYNTACERMSSPRTGFLPSLYIRELCSSESHIQLDTYDQILIDEAQFFAPSWLELVKMSIKDSGQLFMCADPNQGFLKSRLSWKSVGLNVRGRTKKLSYSYRTTYEIMVAANALLQSLKQDTEDFIQPDLSKMTRGQKPRLIYTDSSQDEQARFINELQACINNNRVPLNQIIVLCSETVNPWVLKTTIENQIQANSVINCNASQELKNLGDKIRVVSINACTGMEAGVIFVLGVGSLLDKANNLDLSEEERVTVYEESTRKLYVAMTRAGQKLVLFSTQKLPDKVEELLDVEGSYFEP